MLRNMRIGARPGAGFGAVLTIFVVAVGVVTSSLNVVDGGPKPVAEESLPYATTACELNIRVTEVTGMLTDVGTTRDLAALQEAEQAARTVPESLAKFREMFRRENDAKALAADASARRGAVPA